MDDEIPEFLKAAITDYYYGWQLVELLDIGIEDIVEAFEERILDNLPMIEEDIGYDDGEE